MIRIPYHNYIYISFFRDKKYWFVITIMFNFFGRNFANKAILFYKLIIDKKLRSTLLFYFKRKNIFFEILRDKKL